MLGHTSIVTTADIYTTVLSEAARDAAQATAAFVLDAARTRLSLGGASKPDRPVVSSSAAVHCADRPDTPRTTRGRPSP
ncbi:hypothetical protein [Melissospora conviva]|uniref:hypothetical protein n=1 Tax=Melissospora conviva TaxID=3388432 RepID=UPI003C171763